MKCRPRRLRIEHVGALAEQPLHRGRMFHHDIAPALEEAMMKVVLNRRADTDLAVRCAEEALRTAAAASPELLRETVQVLADVGFLADQADGCWKVSPQI